MIIYSQNNSNFLSQQSNERSCKKQKKMNDIDITSKLHENKYRINQEINNEIDECNLFIFV